MFKVSLFAAQIQGGLGAYSGPAVSPSAGLEAFFQLRRADIEPSSDSVRLRRRSKRLKSYCLRPASELYCALF